MNRTLSLSLLVLLGCASPLADDELLAEEILNDEILNDEVASSSSALDLTAPLARCWWDPAPQESCLRAGRVPTCPSCTCLDCYREDVSLWQQKARIELNTGEYALAPGDLRPHVVIGIGAANKPTEWVYRDIDPADVIGSSTWVSVPSTWHHQEVFVWFVRDDGNYSLPLPGTALLAP